VSFVVRVVVDRQGQAGGVVERVATGGKEAFRDLEAIGRVLRTMLRDERRRPATRAELRLREIKSQRARSWNGSSC
jgi:hypothetical protein